MESFTTYVVFMCGLFVFVGILMGIPIMMMSKLNDKYHHKFSNKLNEILSEDKIF